MTDTCTPATALPLGDDAIAEHAATMKALGEPLRLRLMLAIARDARGECCVCDLHGLTDVSQPTVSHHLTVLKRAGLVTAERRGTWVWYRPTERAAEQLAALADLLEVNNVPASTSNESACA